MDKQRLIIYTVTAALIALLLFLNNFARTQTRGEELPFTDRSQQSEFERGAGTMRDAKEFKEWAKKNLPDD